MYEGEGGGSLITYVLNYMRRQERTEKRDERKRREKRRGGINDITSR